MYKHDYILNLEKEHKTFSLLKFEEKGIHFPKNLKEKKYSPVQSIRVLSENKKTTIKNYILKSAQGFYICFDKTNHESWDITIYFLEEQENELQFFVNNFLKTFKNATNNN